MAEIDWEAAKSGKRPLKTRDGAPARYLSVLKGGRHAVVITPSWGHEYADTFDDDGACFTSGPCGGLRLIQEPEVIEFKRWMNVYEDAVFVHRDEEEATSQAAPYLQVAIAVPITITKRGDKIVIHGESE